MGEYLTFSAVSVILSLVTAIIVGWNAIRKPQATMGDEVKDLKAVMQSHKDTNTLEISQLRDAFIDIKKNDLHEMNCRQDSFAQLMIDQTKEMAQIRGQQDVIIKLLMRK